MTYFDPEIYNKYNLSKRDRSEVDFWEDMMDNAFAGLRQDVEFDKDDTEKAFEKDMAIAQLEILDELETRLACSIEEYIVSLIESYDEEEFEKYKAAGDQERAEKGIVYENPYESLIKKREEGAS